jgi:dihydroorotate dehydrogenase electron transfer subunit
MKEHQVIVQRVNLVEGDYIRLELAIPEGLKGIMPGQCLLARPKQMRLQKQWDPYLRERWYPVFASNTVVGVEVKTRAHYRPGDVIDVIAPVGNPLRFRAALRNVLLVAQDTPPFPLLMTIAPLLGRNVSVTLVLLGSAAEYPTSHLPPEVEVIRGEDPADPLAWPNQVTTIGWADQVFAVVAPGDERAAFGRLHAVFDERRAEIGSNYLFGVFQGILPCGVGACDACLIHTNDGTRYACTDGPAFDLAAVKLG